MKYAAAIVHFATIIVLLSKTKAYENTPESRQIGVSMRPRRENRISCNF